MLAQISSVRSPLSILHLTLLPMASSTSSSSPCLSTFFTASSSSFSSLPGNFKLLYGFKPHHKALRVQALPLTSLIHSSATNQVPASSRRGLMSTATLPLLLQLYEFTEGCFPVNATELNANDCTFMKEKIKKVVTKAKAAGVLRLVFHDAGTFEMDENSGGMNGSIVYELDRPENAGLQKSLKVLAKAKTEVDANQQVSWADMIAVAGAEAVTICGGPTIPVTLGRLDSLSPDPSGRIPEESLDASALKQCFKKKGFSTQELVALSGAHTLGSKGFGNPNVFDNSYYKILLQKPWSSADGMTGMIGLPSDRALVEDEECVRWIKAYANDQNLFFDDFKDAYIKLVNSGAKWRSL